MTIYFFNCIVRRTLALCVCFLLEGARKSETKFFHFFSWCCDWLDYIKENSCDGPFLKTISIYMFSLLAFSEYKAAWSFIV